MALSTVKKYFGANSLTMYNPDTYKPYGIIRLLNGLSVNMTGELIDLFGGASNFSWGSARGVISTDLSATAKEFSDMQYEKLLGATVTSSATAEASGNCTTLTNKKGTSVKAATTGIATATVKTASVADLKDGIYIVKAVNATTVNVYCMSNVDFTNGTVKTYEDDDLKITSAALTITASAAVEIPGFGIELTGGSGTIGMTAGDTAYFQVRKVNLKGYREISVGSTNLYIPEFGLLAATEKLPNGSTMFLNFYRVAGVGMPIETAEKAWAGTTMNFKAYLDEAQNKVFTQYETLNA